MKDSRRPRRSSPETRLPALRGAPAKSVLRAAMSLSPLEREAIAIRLFDSLGEPVASAREIAAAWSEEIERRMLEIELAPAKLRTSDAFFHRLESTLREQAHSRLSSGRGGRSKRSGSVVRRAK